MLRHLFMKVSVAIVVTRYRYRRPAPGFIALLFEENSRKSAPGIRNTLDGVAGDSECRATNTDSSWWYSRPCVLSHERKLVGHHPATTCRGVADYGVNSPSISNGWPGPQPVTKNRIAATKIKKIVVLTTFFPRNIRHFLLEDTVTP